MMSFFFSSSWAQAQGGLNGMLGVLQGVSYAMLAITFLMGVYESFFAGGSLRQLSVTCLKFGVAAAILANWGTFFSDVVDVGTSLANTFLAGNADLLAKWVTDLNNSLATSSLSSLLSNGISALAMSVMMLGVIIVSSVVFLSCMKILTLCFVFWGGVLFCMGPLLIALSPSGMVSSHARTYCRSLAEWAMWPALYALFVTLMNAIGMGNVSAVLAKTGSTPSGFGVGDPATDNAIMLTVISLLYGICVIIIPFIAHYIIGGSFAGVAAGVAGVVKAGAGMVSGGMGAAGGVSTASSTGGGGSTPIGSPDGGSSSSSSTRTTSNLVAMPPPHTASEPRSLPHPIAPVVSA